MTPILTLEVVTNVHRSLFRRCNHVVIIRAGLKAKVGSGIAAASSCGTEIGSCSNWYTGPRRGRNPDKIPFSGSRVTQHIVWLGCVQISSADISNLSVGAFCAAEPRLRTRAPIGTRPSENFMEIRRPIVCAQSRNCGAYP